MKLTKNTLYLALIMLFSYTFAFAGEHIANADITIKCSNGKTLRCKTDASGKFTVPNLDEDCDGFTCSLNYQKIEWSWGASNSGSKVSLVRESPTKSSAAKSREAGSGMATGKRQHKPFTYKATLCPNGDCSSGACVIEFSSNGSTIQGMAINEKGLPGEKVKKGTSNK